LALKASGRKQKQIEFEFLVFLGKICGKWALELFLGCLLEIDVVFLFLLGFVLGCFFGLGFVLSAGCGANSQH
jgi:hypothetical protein